MLDYIEKVQTTVTFTSSRRRFKELETTKDMMNVSLNLGIKLNIDR